LKLLLITFKTAAVSLPVILFAILAASEDEAGGSSPITVLRPAKFNISLNSACPKQVDSVI
jgi:hypothetical protein